MKTVSSSFLIFDQKLLTCAKQHAINILNKESIPSFQREILLYYSFSYLVICVEI